MWQGCLGFYLRRKCVCSTVAQIHFKLHNIRKSTFISRICSTLHNAAHIIVYINGICQWEAHFHILASYMPLTLNMDTFLKKVFLNSSTHLIFKKSEKDSLCFFFFQKATPDKKLCMGNHQTVSLRF